jgi:hypothetical protein
MTDNLFHETSARLLQKYIKGLPAEGKTRM